MTLQRPEGRRNSDYSPRNRGDLVLRAILVGMLWLLLRLLEISSVVAIVTMAAIFGPEAIRLGVDLLRGGPHQ